MIASRRYRKVTTALFIYMAVSGAVLVCGCGEAHTSDSAWLITAGGDTVTVKDAGETWNGMGDRAREHFLQAENPAREFLTTYGQRLLLEKALEDSGYLDDEEVTTATRYWLMNKIVEAAQSKIMDEQQANVSEDEVQPRMDQVGRLAFFTTDPGGPSEASFGPVHIPTLPDDIMNLITGLQPGETGITDDGVRIRLDSVGFVDSTSIIASLPDSAHKRSGVETIVAQLMYNDRLTGIRDSLENHHGLSIDSDAVVQMSLSYGGSADTLSPEKTVMQSDLGTWTAGDVVRAVDFYSSSQDAYPEETEWLYSFLDYLHFAAYAEDFLSSSYPGVLDSLNSAAEEYRFDQASGKFYQDSISSGIEVSQEDMEEIFRNLDQPITMPEMRMFQAINISTDSAMIFAQLPDSLRPAFLETVPGFPWMAADSANPQYTAPVSIHRIPGFNGDTVFAMDPSDTTTWLGPLDMYTPARKCFFRLRGVLPEHPASFEEAEPQLETMARERLEQQATLELLQQLQDRYGMKMNEAVLEELPKDPGEWDDIE